MSALLSTIPSWMWQTAGWTMIHYLWVGTAIWAVAGAGRWALRSAEPQTRYLFSLASLFALVSGAVAAAVAVALVDDAAPSPWASLPILQKLWAAGTADALAAIIDWLPCIWIAGSAVALGMVVLGLVGAERLRRHSELQQHGPLTDQCRRLAHSMNFARHIGVATCERCALPMLIGIVRPLILLPPAALNGWTPEQLEMVLLHELAHIRRWDNLTALIQRLVESALFFHPAVWIVSGWVQRDREFSCDAFVLARTNRRWEYARMLTDLAAAYSAPPRALASSLGQLNFAARIRRILNTEEEPMRLSRIAMTCFLACFTSGLGLFTWVEAQRSHAADTAAVAAATSGSDQPDAERATLPESTKEEVVSDLPATLTRRPQVVVGGAPDPFAGEAVEVATVVEAVPPEGAKRDWGPEQAEGPPDTQQAGDIVTAWASLTPDGQAEWITCEYAAAMQPKAVVIHETFNPGAVNKLSAFDGDGKEIEVWAGTDPTPRDTPKGVSIIPIKIAFKTQKIKVYVDSTNVPGWNEIDAVGLRDEAGETHWARKIEASSTYASQSPARVVSVDSQRLARLDEEVKKLRKEVDRLKAMEAEVEKMKALLKERQQ